MVKPREMKVLGLKWDKHSDTLKDSFPSENIPATRRCILRKLARIYDPLGLVSPLTLEGKLIYRDVSDAKLPWDAGLSSIHLAKWQTWERFISSTTGTHCSPHGNQPLRERLLCSTGKTTTDKVCMGGQHSRTPLDRG